VERSLPPRPTLGGALGLDGPGWSGTEVVAGVTLVALSLPMNIGYAAAAGLPPTAGIYASIVPVVVFAVATGSRRLVVGPDATIAALLAAGLAPVVAMGVVATEAALGVAVLTGAFLLVGWVLRLGKLVRFISKAVLVGFIAGLGVEILTSQVKKILAVEVEADGWVEEVVGIVTSLPEASIASVVVGVSTIVLVVLLRRLAPRAPGALVALVLVGGAVAWFEPAGVAVLGDVESGLPTLTFPVLPLAAWLELTPIALAIAALTTAEGLTISQNAGRRNGESLEPNGELLAYSLANVAGACTGSMPIGASASRTAALAATGARTQMPAVVSAVGALAAALFLSDVIGAIPTAALGGLVATAVVSTIEVPVFRRLAGVRRGEFVIAVGCAVAVLLLGPLPGIVLAVLVSAVDVARRAATMPWVELGGAPTEVAIERYTTAGGGQIRPGLLLLRPEGPLFFANADSSRHVLESAADLPTVRWVVIDLEAVSDIDPTAADALAEGIDAATAKGTTVAVSRAFQPIQNLLERYGLIEELGADHVFASNRAAVDAFDRSARSGPAAFDVPGPAASPDPRIEGTNGTSPGLTGDAGDDPWQTSPGS
jgi:sulfate permease, SulP family